MAKKPKLKKGTEVYYWNGGSFKEGRVSNLTKNVVDVEFNGKNIPIEKEVIKYQVSFKKKPDIVEYDEVWRWIIPEHEINLIYSQTKTVIEGEWEKTYNQTGKLRYIRFIGKIWFLQPPYEFLTEAGYTVSKENAILLEDLIDGKWVDTAYWFCAAAGDYKDIADEIIKWMIGPLKELISYENIELKQIHLGFTAPEFGKLVSQVTSKKITFTMGKEILGRMFKGEKLNELLEDPKYKASSSDELLVAVKKIIIDNPAQVEDLKGGKDKILGWLVGQVMKELKGKANAAEVNRLFREELEL